MPAQKPGPRRNVQSWKATSVCPATVNGGRVRAGELLAQGDDRMTLMSPATMIVDSTMRRAT